MNGQTKTFRQYWETKVGFHTVLRCHVLCPCTSYRLRPRVFYLTVSSRVLIQKLTVPQLDIKLPAHHEASTVLSFSKQPANCTYPEPLSLTPHDVILFFLSSILMFPSHLRLGLPRSLFFCFPPKRSVNFSSSEPLTKHLFKPGHYEIQKQPLCVVLF